MDILITMIVISVILFVLFGFAAIVLDQRSETRHWEEMYEEERRDNNNLHDKVEELNQKIRDSKSDKVGV